MKTTEKSKPTPQSNEREAGVISNANKHLTLEERRIIRIGIEHGSTKAAIAQTIGKEKSTIGKEIRLHRVLRHDCSMPLECNNYRKCAFGRQCTTDCPEYSPFQCTRRDRSPGACNGCSQYSKCRFNKYYYEPEKAEEEYKYTLTDARIGVNLTTSEAKNIGDIVAPLVKQGQAPYQIVHEHPEIGICEKTLYNYIKDGVLKNVCGIMPMDLRRTVSRKITKKDSDRYKKRENRKYLNGRTYADYLHFIADNPSASVVQMDTVYNDETNGPFMQTFRFLMTGFFFAVLHDRKTADCMVSGVILLETVLGRDLFEKYVQVILTDRGSEFSNPEAMEIRQDTTTRTRVFYCDPMRSNQKGSLENKHIELRYICPKGTDLRSLGLVNQDKMNLVLSHLNSVPSQQFAGKSSFEMMQFLCPEVAAKFEQFRISMIPKDSIVLKPYLLK